MNKYLIQSIPIILIAFIVSLETAAYAALSILFVTKIMEFLYKDSEPQIGLMVISDKSKLIAQRVKEKFTRSKTEIKKIETMAEDDNYETLYMVTDRYHYHQLKQLILTVDAKAFYAEYDTRSIDPEITKFPRRPDVETELVEGRRLEELDYAAQA